jgi:hypothetical protein
VTGGIGDLRGDGGASEQFCPGPEPCCSSTLAKSDATVSVLNDVLLPAMKDVGDPFGAGELILPFVLRIPRMHANRVSANITTAHADVESLPFADCGFDAVRWRLGAHVLHRHASVSFKTEWRCFFTAQATAPRTSESCNLGLNCLLPSFFSYFSHFSYFSTSRTAGLMLDPATRDAGFAQDEQQLVVCPDCFVDLFLLLLPPCVNQSGDRFAVEPTMVENRGKIGAIRVPLTAIRGFGPEAAQHTAAVRAAFGESTSLSTSAAN